MLDVGRENFTEYSFFVLMFKLKSKQNLSGEVIYNESPLHRGGGAGNIVVSLERLFFPAAG